MPPSPCQLCQTNRALILRPKNGHKLCKPCFLEVFEAEIHHTITSNNLFHRGERIAIGASGGKDSTVLASVLKTLNERYDYGVELILLSIDEGIKGYRDDSLETVKRNAKQYEMPLMIVGYDELYGWTMDQVVEQVGKKGNLLRGDLPRLSRTTSIVTSTPSVTASPNSNTPSHTNIKRSKPLKYAYEKEIVLYAHHKSLDYFSTECIYSPEAFRGSARALIKNLERVRPSAILDVVRSGEDMAKLVPGGGSDSCGGACGVRSKAVVPETEDEEGGCGSSAERSMGGEMAAMEKRLVHDEQAAENGLETEVTLPRLRELQPHRQTVRMGVDGRARKQKAQKGPAQTPRKLPQQKMGQCERCGYLSSQAVCKACVLLEGLNKSRPRTAINIVGQEDEREQAVDEAVNAVRQVSIAAD